METQHVPASLATDAKGETYARVAPTSFPAAPDGNTVVLHRITAYNKSGAVGRREGVVRRRRRPSAARSTRRRRRPHASRARAARRGRSTAETTPKEQKVAAGLEIVRHARSRWTPPPTATSGTSNCVARPTRRTARSSRCPSTTAWRRTARRTQWVVGRARRTCRPRPGWPKLTFRPAQGEAARALRHARRRRQLLEEAGPGGRAVQGEARRRQRGDLLLVSLRRPARAAERRPDRRRARAHAEAGGEAAPRLDEGPRLPAAARPSASSPTSTRR